MCEICVDPSWRSSLLKRDSVLEAGQTARQAAMMTGCEVEIVDHRTSDEQHKPQTII